MNRDDEAEEALITLAAMTGLSTEEAVRTAIIGYATIIQARAGMTCEIIEHKAGGKKRVMRLMVLGDLHESEEFLRSVKVNAAYVFILAVSGFFLVDSIKNKDWFNVGCAIIGVIAAASLGHATLGRTRIIR